MSNYTKAQTWSSINNSLNNIISGIDSLGSNIKRMNQINTNDEFEKRYDDYLKVIDYADNHVRKNGYDTKEGFLYALQDSTGVDIKFADKVLKEYNWDPTRTNNATLTSWMLENNYGINSWKRDKITESLNKNDENKIKNYITSNLVDYANNLLKTDPYSMYDWRPGVNKEYSNLLNAKKISEATGIDEKRIAEILNNSTVKDELDNWIDTELSDKFDELTQVQEKARLQNDTQPYLNTIVDQCVSSDVSIDYLKKYVEQGLVESGITIFGKDIVNKYRTETYEYYINQKSIEFGKNNFLLDDYEFHEKFIQYNTNLRKEIYGENAKEGSYSNNYASAYEAKKNTNQTSEAINVNEVINRLIDNPYIIQQEDFSDDGIAKMMNYDSKKDLISSANEKDYNTFTRIRQQVSTAQSIIDNNNKSLEESVKKYNVELKTEFETAFSENCKSLIKNVSTNTDTIYTFDNIADICSNGLFEKADELLDNAGWTTITDFISTCTQVAKISATNFASNVDEQSIAYYVSQRRNNIFGSSINISNYYVGDVSVKTEAGERTSKKDNMYVILNEDKVETNKTIDNPYYSFNPYQEITDWAIIDDYSKDNNFKTGLKVIDYEGFTEFLNGFKDENLKNDPYFIQSLIIKWNSAYSNLPSTEDEQIMFFNVQKDSYVQKVLHGNIEEGMNGLKSLYKVCPTSEINSLNTTISSTQKAIENMSEFNQINDVITNVIESYNFGDNNEYYNKLKQNASYNLDLAYKYSEQLYNGTKTIDEITQEINDIFALQVYDDSMKQLEQNIKKSTNFVEFISAKDMNLFTDNFKLNYQNINEGTMYNMDANEVANFNSWFINQVNGKTVSIDSIYETLFDVSSNGSDKITIGKEEYKEKKENNPIYSKTLMIKGTLDYVSGKAKYLKDKLIKVNNLKDSDLQLINFKDKDSSYYDIAFYEPVTGNIYLMPNDNSLNNIICMRIDDTNKETLDNNLKSNKLVTVNKYMTSGVTIDYDYSKYLSENRENIKKQSDEASKIITDLNRAEINKYNDWNESQNNKKETTKTTNDSNILPNSDMSIADKYRSYYGI